MSSEKDNTNKPNSIAALPITPAVSHADDMNEITARGTLNPLLQTDINDIIDINSYADHHENVPELSQAPKTTANIYAGKNVYLSIEGGQEVFYRGTYVTMIPLTGDQLLIGRRDVLAGHYPDIDLAMYWKQDRSLSRRHLRIYRNISGAWFVEDICNNNATFINGYDHPLNKAYEQLKPGDRILVSMSIAIKFCVSDN